MPLAGGHEGLFSRLKQAALALGPDDPLAVDEAQELVRRVGMEDRPGSRLEEHGDHLDLPFAGRGI
jgi:hypothetical protein